MLTHLPQNKMAAISQTTFSNAQIAQPGTLLLIIPSVMCKSDMEEVRG